MFNLKNGARRHSQCPGIFVGATWFWAKASYQICMDLDGSATSTVGGQRWSHIEPERFLHVENQDQRIANSWMRYAQWPWNSPHLKHTWRTQQDLKSIDKFSNRHLSCKNIRLDWADGFPLHSTWTAVRSWVESMLIDDSPLITISELFKWNDLKLWRLHQSPSVFHQFFFAISKVTAVDPPRIDNAAGQVLQLTCDSAPNPHESTDAWLRWCR